MSDSTKGCKGYRSNPDDYKNEVALDDKTIKIIEGRVHESVGFITLPDDTTGTGFRVGESYLMSAYHVFRNQIENLIDQIFMIIIYSNSEFAKDEKETMKKLKKYLPVTKELLDKDQPFQSYLRVYLEEHGTNVKQLLEGLKKIIQTETVDAIARNLSHSWRQNCKVEFSKGEIFHLDWDIKFGDRKHDVIIVELINDSPGEVSFPPPLLVDDRYRPKENIQIVQYKINDNKGDTENPTEKHVMVSSKCELYCEVGSFSDIVDKCIKWWESWGGRAKYVKDEMIDVHFRKDCPIQYDKTTGVLITQASRSFTEGSSGSPMIYWLGSVGQPVVTSIFQGGLPNFYYHNLETGYKRARDDEDDNSCGKYLFERGRSMEKVSELLYECGKSDLKDSIFSPLKKVEDHISNCSGRRDPYDYMVKTVEAWEREDKTCYATKGVTGTWEKIQSDTCNCVCVTGDPGSGKSMSIRHAALRLKSEKGFTVYPISSPDDFFKFLDERKSQVFVIDDILGIHSVYKDLMNQWSRHHDVIKCLLRSETKILASLRTQLVQHQNVRLEEFIFLEKSKRVDLYDKEKYKLDKEEMKKMLSFQLNVHNVENIDSLIEIIWGKQGSAEKGPPVLDSFPLLCKMFCKDKKLRANPKTFFNDPFHALIKTFRNMKHENRPLFCGLVLCVAFDGKLSGDNLSTFAQFDGQLDEKVVTLRDHLVRSLRLDPRSDLDSVKSALKASDGVYVMCMGNDFEISHRIFHDIVTYVYDDKLFIFKFGTRQFIKDRVRIVKRSGDDQFVVVCGGDKNIDRLATKLIDDFKSDFKRLIDRKIKKIQKKDDKSESERQTDASPAKRLKDDVKSDSSGGTDKKLAKSQKYDVKSDSSGQIDKKLAKRLKDDVKYDLNRETLNGASFMVENPNIADKRLIDHIHGICKSNPDEVAVHVLFRHCFLAIEDNYENLKQNSNGDMIIPQFQLIKSLIELGADCNIRVGLSWPLHISVLAGSVQLTRLLLENGADKSICDTQCRSVLHLVCAGKYNHLLLIRMFIEADIDKVPAKRVFAVGKHEILTWLMLPRDKQFEFVQLHEVGSSIELAKDVSQIKHTLDKYSGNKTLQLVEKLHDSCLNSVNADKQNVLHLAVRCSDASVVNELLKHRSKLTCWNDLDNQGRSPENWVDDDGPITDRSDKKNLFDFNR